VQQIAKLPHDQQVIQVNQRFDHPRGANPAEPQDRFLGLLPFMILCWLNGLGIESYS